MTDNSQLNALIYDYFQRNYKNLDDVLPTLKNILKLNNRSKPNGRLEEIVFPQKKKIFKPQTQDENDKSKTKCNVSKKRHSTANIEKSIEINKEEKHANSRNLVNHSDSSDEESYNLTKIGSNLRNAEQRNAVLNHNIEISCGRQLSGKNINSDNSLSSSDQSINSHSNTNNSNLAKKEISHQKSEANKCIKHKLLDKDTKVQILSHLKQENFYQKGQAVNHSIKQRLPEKHESDSSISSNNESDAHKPKIINHENVAVNKPNTEESDETKLIGKDVDSDSSLSSSGESTDIHSEQLNVSNTVKDNPNPKTQSVKECVRPKLINKKSDSDSSSSSDDKVESDKLTVSKKDIQVNTMQKSANDNESNKLKLLGKNSKSLISSPTNQQNSIQKSQMVKQCGKPNSIEKDSDIDSSVSSDDGLVKSTVLTANPQNNAAKNSTSKATGETKLPCMDADSDSSLSSSDESTNIHSKPKNTSNTKKDTPNPKIQSVNESVRPKFINKKSDSDSSFSSDDEMESDKLTVSKKDIQVNIMQKSANDNEPNKLKLLGKKCRALISSHANQQNANQKSQIVKQCGKQNPIEKDSDSDSSLSSSDESTNIHSKPKNTTNAKKDIQNTKTQSVKESGRSRLINKKSDSDSSLSSDSESDKEKFKLAVSSKVSKGNIKQKSANDSESGKLKLLGKNSKSLISSHTNQQNANQKRQIVKQCGKPNPIEKESDSDSSTSSDDGLVKDNSTVLTANPENNVAKNSNIKAKVETKLPCMDVDSDSSLSSSDESTSIHSKPKNTSNTMKDIQNPKTESVEESVTPKLINKRSDSDSSLSSDSGSGKEKFKLAVSDKVSQGNLRQKGANDSEPDKIKLLDKNCKAPVSWKAKHKTNQKNQDVKQTKKQKLHEKVTDSDNSMTKQGLFLSTNECLKESAIECINIPISQSQVIPSLAEVSFSTTSESKLSLKMLDIDSSFSSSDKSDHQANQNKIDFVKAYISDGNDGCYTSAKVTSISNLEVGTKSDQSKLLGKGLSGDGCSESHSKVVFCSKIIRGNVQNKSDNVNATINEGNYLPISNKFLISTSKDRGSKCLPLKPSGEDAESDSSIFSSSDEESDVNSNPNPSNLRQVHCKSDNVLLPGPETIELTVNHQKECSNLDSLSCSEPTGQKLPEKIVERDSSLSSKESSQNHLVPVAIKKNNQNMKTTRPGSNDTSIIGNELVTSSTGTECIKSSPNKSPKVKSKPSKCVKTHQCIDQEEKVVNNTKQSLIQDTKTIIKNVESSEVKSIKALGSKAVCDAPKMTGVKPAQLKLPEKDGDCYDSFSLTCNDQDKSGISSAQKRIIVQEKSSLNEVTEAPKAEYNMQSLGPEAVHPNAFEKSIESSSSLSCSDDDSIPFKSNLTKSGTTKRSNVPISSDKGNNTCKTGIKQSAAIQCDKANVNASDKLLIHQKVFPKRKKSGKSTKMSAKFVDPDSSDDIDYCRNIALSRLKSTLVLSKLPALSPNPDFKPLMADETDLSTDDEGNGTDRSRHKDVELKENALSNLTGKRHQTKVEPLKYLRRGKGRAASSEESDVLEPPKKVTKHSSENISLVNSPIVTKRILAKVSSANLLGSRENKSSEEKVQMPANFDASRGHAKRAANKEGNESKSKSLKANAREASPVKLRKRKLSSASGSKTKRTKEDKSTDSIKEVSHGATSLRGAKKSKSGLATIKKANLLDSNSKGGMASTPLNKTIKLVTPDVSLINSSSTKLYSLNEKKTKNRKRIFERATKMSAKSSMMTSSNSETEGGVSKSLFN